MMMNPATDAAAKSQAQDQRPNQKGADKIKDNPTDPTMKQEAPGKRRAKGEKNIPLESLSPTYNFTGVVN